MTCLRPSAHVEDIANERLYERTIEQIEEVRRCIDAVDQDDMLAVASLVQDTLRLLDDDPLVEFLLTARDHVLLLHCSLSLYEMQQRARFVACVGSVA